MSKKLDRSKEKIEEVFRLAKEQGVTVKKSKKRESNGTYKTYERIVLDYADKIHRDFGISDAAKWKPEHFMKYVNDAVEDWKEGKLGVAFTVKQARSAMEFFRHATIKTNTFKSEIQCVDKEEVKKVLDSNHVKRSGKYTHTLSATIKERDVVMEQIEKSRSPHKEAAKHAWKIASETGARLSDILDLKVENINLDGSITFPDGGKVTFEKSKGGLTRHVPSDPETMAYLQKICKGKKRGDTVIRLYNNGQKNKPLSSASAERKISDIVTTAGDKAGLNRTETVSYKYRDENGETRYRNTTVEVTCSFHTARKIFVNERYQFYNKMDEETVNRILEDLKKEEIIAEKYDAGLKRINDTRTSGDRDMHHYEKAVFLTSLDSGHFRNDVLEQFYLHRSLLEFERKRVGKPMRIKNNAGKSTNS